MMVSQQQQNKDVEVPGAAPDSTSSLVFTPTPGQNLLVAGSWDNSVRIWNIQQQAALGGGASVMANAVHSYAHDAPVLCVAAAKDGRVFSAGCDNTAKCYQLGSGNAQPQSVAKHDAPIKVMFYIDDMNVLMTGSWDRTIRYWDLRSSNPVVTVQLPERVYCASVQDELAVVGTADRNIIIYNLRNPTVEYKRMTSPLKFQTRCIACFPDKSGFAIGSIEGRVGIHHIEDINASKNFAFKCHRTDKNIYAVNSMHFHQRYGSLSTTGSDGSFHFWDKQDRQRLKAFTLNGPPIPCSAFSHDGALFSYAVCYDWSLGVEGLSHPTNSGNRIYVHRLLDEEIKPKKQQ